jgi:hypothetical protein
LDDCVTDAAGVGLVLPFKGRSLGEERTVQRCVPEKTLGRFVRLALAASLIPYVDDYDVPRCVVGMQNR